MKPPKPLDGPLDPTLEELAAVPLGGKVYFSVIPGRWIPCPLPSPEIARARLLDLVTIAWLSEFKQGNERFVLLPGDDGQPTGEPIRVTSTRFREWLAARYKRHYHQKIDPKTLDSFLSQFEFQLRVATPQTRRR